jgi:hypothetical protein
MKLKMTSHMPLRNYSRILLISLLIISPILTAVTCSAQYRPSQFFREDWKETPAESPVSQKHVSNDILELGLYGSAKKEMRKSNHDHPSDDPFYVWSGLCQGNWATTLKHTEQLVDLSEFSVIRWRSKQSGFRCLHIILKLDDGTWLVSDQSDDNSSDWRVREFNISDIKWYALNMKSITEGNPVVNPDLSRVDEIGFTDLMVGGQSVACSRVDWIEVYGKPVDR